jgi:hypothetical protein
MAQGHGRIRALLFTGLLCCSLCIGGIGGLGIADGTQRAEAQQPASSGTGGGSEIGDLETESFEADRTVFIITVRENGSATWRFRYEQRLEADADIENFESYADRFNANETDSFRNFRERAVALADSGSNVTGREMSADRFRRDARIEERPPAGDEFGVIEMSFVWSGFATIDGGDVVAGDVFVGGLYVGPDQQLRVERGPNLRFESTAPEPDTTAAGTLSESETITWIGETSFADRQPRVVFVERDAEGAPTGTDSEATSTTQPDQPTDDTTGSTGPIVPLVAIGIVIVLGMSAAFVYRAGLFATGTIETDESPSNRMSDDGGTEAGTTTPASDAGAGETADGSEGPDEGASHPIAEGEFLSDEERVVALLESQGGRMKQVDIVDQTDWSKSKVSMLLSDMESEGTVSKLRVGRENIVSLAGHEPDAAGSPFDNE